MADTRSIIGGRSNINTPSIASSTTALNNNPARSAWNIQNVGTNVLYVNLGGTASTTVFHQALKAGTGASDGTGGTWGQSTGTVFTGPITIAGTSPQYVVMEI